jgi:predicted extracellular nuclease
MNKQLLLLFLALFISLPARPQKNGNRFVVMSYNVENLFDTVNAPQFDDEDFTPGGKKAWTYERYGKKLDDLTRVILSLPGKELPAIIGLAEIENRKVLEDLVANRGIRRAEYEIIHEEGRDPRGIECALLYRPDQFRYRSHEYIPVEDPVDPDYLYRDILHVTGTGPDGSRLHIFMNHWKSRSGGTRETEKKRMFTAITLRKQLDRLLSTGDDLRVILMGDFNDEPTNLSLSGGLSAGGKRKNIQLGDQYNLYYDLHNLEGRGTYGYQGRWNMLDQIIVSYTLLNRDRGLSTSFDGGRILAEEWMLYENEEYGESFPAATYRGPVYYGGPSDHLPVYVIFTY